MQRSLWGGWGRCPKGDAPRSDADATLFGPFCPHFASHVSDNCRGNLLAGNRGKRVATFALVTTVGPNRVLPDRPWVNLAAPVTVKLSPTFLIRLIDKTHAIRIFSQRITRGGRLDPAITYYTTSCAMLRPHTFI